jgi:hypothetical protein
VLAYDPPAARLADPRCRCGLPLWPVEQCRHFMSVAELFHCLIGERFISLSSGS